MQHPPEWRDSCRVESDCMGTTPGMLFQSGYTVMIPQETCRRNGTNITHSSSCWPVYPQISCSYYTISIFWRHQTLHLHWRWLSIWSLLLGMWCAPCFLIESSNHSNHCLRDATRDGIEVWDCENQEYVLLIVWILAFEGDNSMASEFSCHIGMRGQPLQYNLCKRYPQ